MSSTPDPQYNPTVLVTGSSGHLGKALMLALPSHGYTPVGIDILPSSTTTVVGSVADKEFVKEVFGKFRPEHVIHSAALHKPHVCSHEMREFVRVNVEGTAVLLEVVAGTRGEEGDGGAEEEEGFEPGQSRGQGEQQQEEQRDTRRVPVLTFTYISTTSTFGHALAPPPGHPATLISESVVPQPKNIYGVTKTAAENLCKLAHDQTGLPVVVLRVARFFPEEDDAKNDQTGKDGDGRVSMQGDNLKVLELAYRRADIADVVGACVCAVRRAGEVGWGRYVVSAPSPFLRMSRVAGEDDGGGGEADGKGARQEEEKEILAALGSGEVAEAYERVVPGIRDVFARKGWRFLKRVDRVYDSRRAERELGWRAEYTIARAVEKVARGEEWRTLASMPVQALKEVFAHVITGNMPLMDVSDWEADMRLAKESLIDGFVLNIASQDPSNSKSIERAFEAADNVGNFKLFFSFDYEAQGPWSADQVIDLLTTYAQHEAYFKHEGTHPLVSTFEGAGNADDWNIIKQSIPHIFFMPEWSSAGPFEAANLGGSVADGLFSWGAWPEGKNDMTTDLDQAYRSALGNKPYMMPVSPWFFTNLPGWNKNWLWRGDGLWDLRWNQVAAIQPEYVQILTWNDYGESHYIGPVHEKQLELFNYGRAPINYVKDMPHDAWRKFLPFYISVYKNAGQAPAQVPNEDVVMYYRTTAAKACRSGGTVANKAGHGQTEMPPEEVVEDSVFWAALLNHDAGLSVKVSIGGQETWAKSMSLVPPAGPGKPGVYAGSVPFEGRTGEVVVTVMRGGETIATAKGSREIVDGCDIGVQNWNAVVA
ncbi:hypothetical protein VTJ49DRAFT_7710 [Mycothermus thermophilus]|uniref:NAD-dependent epimerase/dehydratase domain-containing protein n=1 Tax=Humicola insolens TaxID=85995 RepID=A0ABR3VI65_HUMIN